MIKSIYSPCKRCNAFDNHYCCGCPNEREWNEWQKSLSNEEWNKLVDEAYERECQKVKKTLDNLKNKFNTLKR